MLGCAVQRERTVRRQVRSEPALAGRVSTSVAQSGQTNARRVYSDSGHPRRLGGMDGDRCCVLTMPARRYSGGDGRIDSLERLCTAVIKTPGDASLAVRRKAE